MNKHKEFIIQIFQSFNYTNPNEYYILYKHNNKYKIVLTGSGYLEGTRHEVIVDNDLSDKIINFMYDKYKSTIMKYNTLLNEYSVLINRAE